MSIVELRGVGKTVRLPTGEPLQILAGVDLVLGEGEHVAIVGRSGSGKSTLLNLLGLLDNPTAGEYRLHGESTHRLSEVRRSRLRGETFGFVFQQFNLLSGRTATENAGVPLRYAVGRQFWQRTRLAREALTQVGLGERLDAMPDKLSGGEQQRVAIARALVRSPQVILADEPTGALDLDTGASVMNLLQQVCFERGATLVTITHDPAIAARADRCYRLDHGYLSAVDDPREAGDGWDATAQTAPIEPATAAHEPAPARYEPAPDEPAEPVPADEEPVEPTRVMEPLDIFPPTKAADE